MNLSNVKLILAREVRDQLRDRRTLFMIAVLPIFLYPLLGISMLQVAQFVREQTTKVLVLGADDLGGNGAAGVPALFAGQHFAETSCSARLLELQFAAEPGHGSPKSSPAEKTADRCAAACTPAEARQLVQSGAYDAALYFPPDFTTRLRAFRESIRRRSEIAPQTKRPSCRPIGSAKP